MIENIFGLQKYTNWKSVTEADYVAMFIKTWFAYIATLTDMFEKPSEYKKGDSWHLSKYKAFFNSKGINSLETTNEVKDAVYNVYKLGRDIVVGSDAFKEYYFRNFHNITENHIKFEDKISKQKFTLDLKFHESDDRKQLVLKGSLNAWGITRNIQYDAKTKMEINLIPIIQSSINSFLKPEEFTEKAFMTKLYSALFDELVSQHELKLDKKIANQSRQSIVTALSKTKLRVAAYLKELKMKHLKDILDLNDVEIANINNERIIRQNPIEGYTFLFEYSFATVISKKDNEQQLAIKNLIEEANKKVLFWYLDFIYLLRNALFHEIINPLDPKWQEIFKNAYIVLSKIVELNIKTLREESDEINNAIELLLSEKYDYSKHCLPEKVYKSSTNSIFEKITYDILKVKRLVNDNWGISGRITLHIGQGYLTDKDDTDESQLIHPALFTLNFESEFNKTEGSFVWFEESEIVQIL